MDVQYVFEKIKQRYEKSNNYMLLVSYEDIGILIHIIEELDKQLKFRKEESNIKLTKEIEELKEKNEYLPNWVSKKYVSKAKIKEKIEEIQNMYDELPKNPKEHLHSRTEYLIVIGELQSLLKEEE